MILSLRNLPTFIALSVCIAAVNGASTHAQATSIASDVSCDHPPCHRSDLLADDDGTFILMWQVQKDEPHGTFDYLRRLGVDAIQAFRLATWPKTRVDDYLDAALRSELKVIVYLGVFRMGDDADCRYSDEGLAFIREYRAHPAVFAWHTIDEPAEHNVSKACQRALFGAVKAIDGERPVMLSANNNTSAKYRNYFAEDAFDILEMHKYVNPGVGWRERRLVSSFQKHRGREYPVIITLRAFNAPHKPRRKPMIPGSLREQYKYFVETSGITPHFGLYGWDLAPNRGISQIEDLQAEFESFMIWRRHAEH